MSIPSGGSTTTFRRGSRASSRESESDTEFVSEFVPDPAPDPPDSDSDPECEVSAHPGGANVSTCCGFGAHPGSSSICARTSASASVSPLGRGSVDLGVDLGSFADAEAASPDPPPPARRPALPAAHVFATNSPFVRVARSRRNSSSAA